MKKLLFIAAIILTINSCSNKNVEGDYVISKVNDSTVEMGGLKSLTIQVQEFEEGKIDIVYYAVDIENQDYSQNWENVEINKNGDIIESLSKSQIFYITGNFSKGKCDLIVYNSSKSKALHLEGKKIK